MRLTRRHPLSQDGPVVYLNVGDIHKGRVELRLSGRVSEDAARAWSGRVTPRAGDVVFGYEATVGEAALLTSDHRWCLGRRVGLLRPRPDRIDPRFLVYSWYTPRFQETLRANRVGGTTIESIRLTDLPTWTIQLPDLDEQHRIAGILGALDDKIGLNRRMSQVLETTARALFQSWFVDFDPVRAKAERHDTGLPEQLADLFPDALEDSELGEIPSGWHVAPLDSEFELTMGQSPPGDTYNDIGNGPPFYQGRVDFGFRFPTRRVYCTAPTRFARAGDTLVSVRAPVGDTNIAWEDCAIGRGIAAVRHRTTNRTYTYEFMRSLASVFARFNAEGTVFGSIGKRDFHEIPCIVPPPSLVTLFGRLTGPVDNRIESGEREARILASVRDVLLPKLISGDLQIKDAERSTRTLTERSPASRV